MQLQLFNYESEEEHILKQVRTVEIDGEIWFVASDVAKILGYAKPSNAINTHCKTRGTLKQGIPTKGGNQEVILINEPNVYRLVIKSKLPSAEKFENWLFEEVIPTIRKKGFYGKINRTELPNFIERYRDNFHKIPSDHFSVISEMFARLHIELEKAGYIIPNRGLNGKQIMPDISVGRGFAQFLRENNSEFFETHKTYLHSFPDSRRDVEANMYHIDALPMFIRYIHEQWVPQKSVEYFKSRDPIALDYLPKLLR